MEKYYVYILESDRGRHYIGQTSDLQRRIAEHNSPHHGFTGTSENWMILEYIELRSRSEAMKLEHYLKKLKNYKKAIEYVIKLKNEKEF